MYGLVDFLVVSETKLDSSFPTGQFNLPGFRAPFRKDLSGKSGVLLVYVNNNIPSKVLKIPDCSKILDKYRGSYENTVILGEL